MLPHLIVLLPLAAATTLKAVSYGETRSAQTLFKPLPSPISTNDNVDDNVSIGSTHLLEDSGLTNASKHIEATSIQDVSPSEESDIAISIGIENSNRDLEVPGPVPEDILPNHDLGGIEKRQAEHRGVMQIDCYLAPDICKNAGWYQNCERKAYGDITKVLYTNGARDSGITRGNRVQSGVKLSGATPCNGWPFAQRFWHVQNDGLENPKLQTDEWPMATFENSEFDPLSPFIQVSLRCMPYYQNAAGSSAWTHFRNCNGPYDPDPDSDNYAKWGGKYAYGTRTGDCDKMPPGDTFYVNFNFSSFPPPRENATADRLRKELGYAEGPEAFPDACVNDGFQFHLSQLRGTESGGAWGQPYDSGVHSAYRLANQFEDIKEYHLTLEVWGTTDFENGEVTISYVHDEKEQLVARQAGPLAVGQSILIYQSSTPNQILQLPFHVTRTSFNYQFDYGNAETDGIRWFGFNDEDAGFERWPKKGSDKPVGQYCYTTVDDADPRGPAKWIRCQFPAW